MAIRKRIDVAYRLRPPRLHLKREDLFSYIGDGSYISVQNCNLADDGGMSMERKEVITTLEDLRSRCPKYIKEYQALGYAISSVKTDEAYQLEYEDRDCVEVIRCKDCKYFEYDTFAKVDGVPLIVGHEMCNKWGEGCKTSENGYCFLAEAKG